MENFGRRILQRRIECDISQKAMAEAIGVAQSTYSLYENGRREPDMDKILKISRVLHITVDELFGNQPQKEPFMQLYEQLDAEDRGEIRGVMRQMLKNKKYKGGDI